MKTPGGRLLFCLLLLCGMAARAADQFGDISVDASAIYTGNTHHGYAEMRVLLLNGSHEKSHLVTLVYPNDSHGGMGNRIGRLSRAILLAPEARQVVSLLQPPLPAQGDSQIQVEVDGRLEGQIRAPNANSHCALSGWHGGGYQSSTVLVSRSLNFDPVQRAFNGTQKAFTAEMAVGPPDARGGDLRKTWMPNGRSIGASNWLELDYATPQPVDEVVIYTGATYYAPRGPIARFRGGPGSPLVGRRARPSAPVASTSAPSPGPIGTIELVGRSGTHIATIPLTLASGSEQHTFSWPLTAEPVKTVRLEFDAGLTARISIDAVQISGPSGAQWASAARASSDDSASVSSRTPDEIDCLRAESPVAEWSANWLAYTPFDCIVLSSADLRSMPTAVLGALGDCLAAGGYIVLAGQTNLPQGWVPWQKEVLGAGMDYRVAFGRCLAFPSDDFSTLRIDACHVLSQEARDNSTYWRSLPRDNDSANASLPIVANLEIPTRGIVIVMLAFVIAIGPVNILCLNRFKRRTWMLWTIPAISLLTTLIVFAYSFLREGITPDARVVGMTVIDQAGHHASTLGATAFYCPLAPAGGLHFDFGTEATPLLELGYRGNAREVDWTQAQHFRRGWLASRVPAYFHLRKSETRRERIQVLLEGGQWQAVNGLGAPIRQLWVGWTDGHIYQAAGVAAGAKTGLTVSKPSCSGRTNGMNELWRRIGFSAQPDVLREGAAAFLQTNTYIAVLDGNPFLENALGAAASPKRTHSSSIVYGFLEPTVAR